ncbi:MAG: DUF1223 domain-containing protein [Pontiella sp.]
MKLPFFLILALFLSHHVAAEQRYVSGPGQVDLVELYTSEGCSSCPPAERRMNEYAKEKGLWSEFIPVAFHVDYWNYLGWTDPFSAPEFSARQRSYSKEWKTRTVFTPCFVVNGKVNSKTWRKSSRDQPGILSVSITENKASVSFIPTHPTQQKMTLWIAPLCGEVSSAVTSGENRGRKLEHNFVALGLHNQKMDSQDQVYTTSFPFTKHPKAKAVAIWVTVGQSLKPVQATGGWLE